MRLLRLNHVQVSVPKGSEDEIRRFYCGVLGLTEIPKPEVLIPRGGLWLAIGDGQLHFGTEDVEGREKSKRHVAFDVADLDEARARLESAGVKVQEGVQIPGYRRFEFRDPFGNRIELLERTS
jgi:catechol 2,3-dioxygenase-like lactoylglutathione lyase family enzyme